MSTSVERGITKGRAKRDGTGVKVNETDILLNQVDDLKFLHEDGHNLRVPEGHVILVEPELFEEHS